MSGFRLIQLQRIFYYGALLQAFVISCFYVIGHEAVADNDRHNLKINEAVFYHVGEDTSEFVELVGLPNTPLSGLSLIAVNADTKTGAGTIDWRYDFRAFHRLGWNGYFLTGSCDGLMAHYDVIPDKSLSPGFLKNSAQTLALVKTDSIGGQTITGHETVLDAIAISAGSSDERFFFNAPILGPNDNFLPAGVSRVNSGTNSNIPDDWAYTDFFLGKGTTPTGGGLDGCHPIEVSIPEIQGNGQWSSYLGEQIITSGIVTQTTANGDHLWVQDQAGDGRVDTSDGIFIQNGGLVNSSPAQIGDSIQVIAQVEERQIGLENPLTQLSKVLELRILSSGNPLPAPILIGKIPDSSIQEVITYWERLEGMLVSLDEAVVVGPTSEFGEFVLLSADNIGSSSGYDSNTHILAPRLEQSGNHNNGVNYNPERIIVDDYALFEPVFVGSGDRVEHITGVVDYSFGNYKLQASNLFLKTKEFPTMPVSRRHSVDGNIVITNFNLHEFFDPWDNPTKSDEGSTPGKDEFEKKLKKLVLAVVSEIELAEIIVVQEVENSTLLRILARHINASAGTAYSGISFESSDSRGLEVGFLWDKSRVELTQAYQMKNTQVDRTFGASSPHPGPEPIVGHFTINQQELIIIGAQFENKETDGPLFGIVQPALRSSEKLRIAQARVLREYVDQLLLVDPNQLLMVAGGLNDYFFPEVNEELNAFEILTKSGNASFKLHDVSRIMNEYPTYSSIIDGNGQLTDFIVVSPALRRKIVGANVLHFNARFPNELQFDPSTSVRSSDHDPIESRFQF